MIKQIGTALGIGLVLITDNILYKAVGCLIIIGFMSIKKKRKTFTRIR